MTEAAAFVDLLCKLGDELRECGFTSDAMKFPRTQSGFEAICAFNGARPEKAPRAWRFAPNPWCLENSERLCWAAVEERARAKAARQ